MYFQIPERGFCTWLKHIVFFFIYVVDNGIDKPIQNFHTKMYRFLVSFFILQML